MQRPKISVSELRQRGLASWIGAGVGFAVGGPLTRTISTAARPGQLPGFASVNGFSPHGYMLRFAVLILATFAGAVLAVQIAKRIRTRILSQRPDGRTAGQKRGPDRKSSFWHSQLLLPFLGAHSLTVWLFLEGTRVGSGIAPLLLLAISLLASAALTALLGRGELQRGVPFLSTAALVLPAAFWQGRTAGVNAFCAAAALFLPLAASLFKGSRSRRLMTSLGVVVLLPGSITALSAAASMSSPRVADIFEDGHSTLPASEYLRGEIPFRDIVPGHGLLSDGVIQLAHTKLFGDDYRGLHLGDKALAGC